LTKLGWAVAVAACAAVTGCSSRTDVSAAATVPPQYTHVWFTVQALWFNTSSTATPEDTTWSKFSLSKPVTLDLASLTSGTLGQIASKLKVPPGTYAQIRLLPVDETTALTSSASDAGARFNSEADFTDSAGQVHQVPLELLNPEKGIGVQTSIKLKADNNATSGSDTTASLAVVLDMHDLARFDYGTQPGVLLNPHAAAYDVSATGTIQGTVDLTSLGTSVDAGGRVNVSVTAEGVSSDGTRHVAVRTVPVATDGTFVLYPLPTDSTTPTTYDLVIHGPRLATVIIKSVPVNVGDPTTTGVASVGTVPTRAATSFTVNLTADTQTVPPGALIGFYQTLPQSGEIPYLIDEVPLDPLSGTLFEDHPLSQDTIDFGTYVGGGNVTLATVTPRQGSGTYALAAQAPLFADGTLTTTAAPPSDGTGTVSATVRALKPAAGSVASTLPLTVFTATAGKYNHGDVIVSHDGEIIQTASLDSALAQGGVATMVIGNLPAGDAADVYYLSFRAWNSRDPAGTLLRQSIPTPADLRSGSNPGLLLIVN